VGCVVPVFPLTMCISLGDSIRLFRNEIGGNEFSWTPVGSRSAPGYTEDSKPLGMSSTLGDSKIAASTSRGSCVAP
jgi:hypothetical protein